MMMLVLCLMMMILMNYSIIHQNLVMNFHHHYCDNDCHLMLIVNVVPLMNDYDDGDDNGHYSYIHH